MTDYKLKFFMAMALLEGLRLDLEHRFITCPECDFTKDYVNYAIKTLEEEMDN